MSNRFIPETPGGSVLAHLVASSEKRAWRNLAEELAGIGMYPSIQALKARGYKVVGYEPVR
jgi:hypothetical protein